MGKGPTFRCPECRDGFEGSAFQAHMVGHPAERAALFERHADEEGVAHLAATRCSGLLEIVPLMELEETVDFGAAERICGPIVVRCLCGGSYCHLHTFNCASCGRFACLRHRWSGRCPACSRGRTARPVKIDKYDPFSKKRSTFIRTYPRPERPDVWHPLQDEN